MTRFPLLATVVLTVWSIVTDEISCQFVRRLQQNDVDNGDVQVITESEVRDLFNLWNDALATLDPDAVVARYSREGVLVPTVSDTVRDTPELIRDYFVEFLKNEPQGVILDGTIRIGNNWAQDAGTYEFTFGASGAIVPARYTFVYIWEDGEWKISHHHSSLMPEGTMVQHKMTVWGVRELFQLWNSALATLDSEKVTSRYAVDAVLLPTVSDTPRTTHELIKEYFDEFLVNEPSGTILESYVTIGTNWAQDVGIYEFVFAKTGAVVRARYSYVYVIEDGIWKIKHHHSSYMPESLPAAAVNVTSDEVRGLFSLWDASLATLDASNVTALYSENPMLIATDSDLPRTSPSAVKAYYREYLRTKPSCAVVSGDIIVGHNWAQDAGIMECTYDNDTKEMDRYTMVYVYEHGDWKISHHHSSFLPEAKLA